MKSFILPTLVLFILLSNVQGNTPTNKEPSSKSIASELLNLTLDDPSFGTEDAIAFLKDLDESDQEKQLQRLVKEAKKSASLKTKKRLIDVACCGLLTNDYSIRDLLGSSPTWADFAARLWAHSLAALLWELEEDYFSDISRGIISEYTSKHFPRKTGGNIQTSIKLLGASNNHEFDTEISNLWGIAHRDEHWALLYAAKNGRKEAIDQVVKMYKKFDPANKPDHSALRFVRQPETTQILIDWLYSDAIYSEGAPRPNSGRWFLFHLSQLVEDCPFDARTINGLEPDACFLAAREWFKQNRDTLKIKGAREWNENMPKANWDTFLDWHLKTY